MNKQHKVLVVDDDPYILMSLEFLMKKSGYQVMIARNGTEALNTVNAYVPDLVLLDIMMPDVDGYAICNYIKTTPGLDHCKVIFLSARSREVDVKKGYSLGAELYISKPFSTRVLIQKVQELLASAGDVAQSHPYADAYALSLTAPELFWKRQAEALPWLQEPEEILFEDAQGQQRWFGGGRTNACWLALDRHVEEGRARQTALIYDSPVTNTVQKFTYRQLTEAVALMAGGLKALGIAKGDTVIIYMPMIPQAVMAMLACARIGAVHSVVFGGFAPHELALRIDDAKPKALITTSYGIEYDRKIAYKPLVDRAVAEAGWKPPHTIIFQRPGLHAEMDQAGDIDLELLLGRAQPAPVEPLEATDPLYILYTSGTTGKPKGIVRDHGGYAVALKYSMKHVYNAEPGDVFWAASDVGWVVGHSYIVYGPLLHGCTTILYEGKPVRTPDAGAFWRVIADHKVKILFTAPTAMRAIRKEDPQGLLAAEYDLSHFRYLFLAGERCDPATWHWVKDLLQVPVIDHWWQTESGWPMLAIMMGLEAFPPKAGSAGKPVCGYDVRILDEEGRDLPAGAEGYVAVRLPLPPGTLYTLWQQHDSYRQSYLSQFEGYYLTGDGGYKDEEGYFYIMGRIDDVINVAGHRLSTGEIEEVVAHHPAVAECAVVGIADELRGQRPVAFVVLKDGNAVAPEQLEEELVQLVRDQVGAIACFRTALSVKSLPKTRSGKILRKLLRQMADGVSFVMPSTIEDAGVISELQEQLKLRKMGVAFQ